MHDMRLILAQPHALAESLIQRGLKSSDEAFALLADLKKKDEALRITLTQLQRLQERRNALSKDIGGKKSRGEDSSKEEQAVNAIKEERVTLEKKADQQKQEIHNILANLPNLLDGSVPDGADESDNKVLDSWGDIKKSDDFLDHVALGERLGLMDFGVAAQMAGARFVVLRGALARLERALASFMLNTHCQQHGYEEVAPPLLVRDHALYGTGQLPKFSEDLYQTREGWWLSPTAEVQLANVVAQQTLDEASLPLRLTAHTACFRSEAGAAGKDTRGMIRQHQFYKVELVSVCHPSQSADEHERMTQCAEAILRALQLPYRKVLLCSGDTGFAAQKTYDLEVWMAGQQCYREISSSSNCGDFQARRLGCMVKGASGKCYAHTLNASGVAVGRCLISVMENYQQKDGSIVVPDVLQPYLGGMKRIE